MPDPAADDFEVGAVRWMLDLGPGDWRTIPVYARQPLVLAFRLGHDLDGRIQAARAAYGSVRRSLGGHLPPDGVEVALEALAAEGAALAARRREVELVAEALTVRSRAGGRFER